MINYLITAKVNPRDLLAERKFYAVKRPQGEVNVRELARRISRETMLSTVETTAVIEALLLSVPEILLEGKVVRLGELGTFRLSLSSQGAESLETFSPNLISRPKVSFRPGKEFSDKMKQAKYSKANVA